MKEFIPPILLRNITGLFYGWSGDYSSWKEAQSKCTGYDSTIIFDKVKEALLKVKNNEAVFERDSILFDKVHYSFPLLSALSLAALKNNRVLNVLDFGGSFGSSYFQNKTILKELDKLNWNIVEQKHFVKEGQSTFANEQLQFYYDIESCLKEQKVNFLLFASVIQYLEKPYDLLKEAIENKIEYIFIDRTPVFIDENDRITIQKVHKSIYDAKYPSWIFNEVKLLSIFKEDYELIYDCESNEKMNLKGALLKGYFFKLKK